MKNTSQKHTPGPWVAKPQPGQTVGVHTYTHCVMYGDDSIADTLTEADARLISASPDLLAVCEDVLKNIHDEGENHPLNRFDFLDALRAAIAKAAGGAA
jgi:hypothetical protein